VDEDTGHACRFNGFGWRCWQIPSTPMTNANLGEVVANAEEVTDASAEPLNRLLDSPRFLAFSVLACVAMALPSLWIGWLDDDYLHRAMVDGRFAPEVSELDLYCFEQGSEGVHADRFVMWWSHPSLKTCFLRPLASLSLSFDHRVLRDHPALAHLESLLLFAVFASCLFMIARDLFGRRTATLALLMMGLSSSLIHPVSWIANRHTILTAAFAAVGFLFYLRGRRGADHRLVVVGWIGMLFALASSEAGLGVWAMAFAYELLQGDLPRPSRFRNGAAIVGVCLTYLIVYVFFGFGALHSEAYIGPHSELVTIFTEISGRFVAVMGEWILGFPANAWILPEARPAALTAGFVAIALLIATIVFGWRGLDAGHRRSVVSLGVGGFAAFLPGLPAPPSGRLLTVAMLALMPALAALIIAAIAQVRSIESRGKRVVRWIPISLVFLGLFVLSPLVRVAQMADMLRRAHAERELIAAGLDGCEAGSTVYILSSRDLVTSIYAAYLLDEAREPRGFFTLTVASAEVELRRSAPEDVEIRAVEGSLVSGLMLSVFRPPGEPLTEGDRVQRESVTIEVTEVKGSDLSSVRLHQAQGFPKQEVCIVRYDGSAIVPVELPATGEMITIEFPVPLMGF